MITKRAVTQTSGMAASLSSPILALVLATGLLMTFAL